MVLTKKKKKYDKSLLEWLNFRFNNKNIKLIFFILLKLNFNNLANKKLTKYFLKIIFIYKYMKMFFLILNQNNLKTVKMKIKKKQKQTVPPSQEGYRRVLEVIYINKKKKKKPVGVGSKNQKD
jgi:hypothetical protein